MARDFETRLAAAEFFADRAATWLADAETADDDSAASVHEVPRHLAMADTYARLAGVNVGLHAAGAEAPWYGEGLFERRAGGAS
jgi:hypothetical protein